MTETIGVDLVPDLLVTGTILSDGKNGNADLTIPVTGKRGSGMLIGWVQQSEGQWKLCSLLLKLSNGREVIVLDDAKATCERE